MPIHFNIRGNPDLFYFMNEKEGLVDMLFVFSLRVITHFVRFKKKIPRQTYGRGKISVTWKIIKKIEPAFTVHSKCVTATLNFELIYLNVYFDCYFFLSINLIHIKHRHDISVLKSFNNSPACIYFHSKCLTARLSFELYLCFFIYSFIHSLIHIFFTIIYLFHFI